MKRCEEDQGLAEDVMQEGKTWSKCFNYIVEQARKQSNGRSTAVEDRVVYEWAEDYYHKYEKPETAKKEKDKKIFAYKIDKHGAAVKIPGSYYDSDTKTVNFVSRGFFTVAVGCEK